MIEIKKRLNDGETDSLKISYLMWAGKFIIGGLIIGYWDLKEFLEKRKRKGV